MSQPNDKLKEFHKNMLEDGYKIPAKVEDFARDMQDKGKRQRFYTNLKKDGYNLKDFDGFSRDILGEAPTPPAGMQIGVPVPLADNVHNRAKAKADEMLGRGSAQLGKPQESPEGRPQTWTQAAGGAIGFPQLDAKTLRPVRKVNNPHKVNLKAKLMEADDRIYSTPVVEQDAPVPYRTDVDLSDPSSVTHPVYFTDPSTGMRYYPSNDGQYLAKDMRTGKVSVLSDYEAKQVDLAFERANFDTPDLNKAGKVSSQVKTMSDEVDQAIKERTEQLAKEHKEASESSPWLTAIADVHNQRVGQYSVYGLDKDTEYNTLKAAQLALKESQGMIDEASKNGASSFAGGALRGFTDKIADPTTWDSGASALNESMMTSIALTKADRGEPLSKGERLLLDAKAKQLATQMYFADGLGYGYKAGEVTAQAIPFMLEMVMGGGIKTAGDSVASGLARYAMRRFGAQIAKEGARKAVKAGIRFGSGAIGKSVAAAGMSSTFGAMRVAADAQRRMDGDVQHKERLNEETGETEVVYGGHGEGDDFGTAFSKAFTAQALEYGTEYAGDYIGKAASAAGKILGKAGSSSAAKLAGIAAGKGAAAPVAKALLAASSLGSKGVAPVADLVRRIGSSNWTKGMQSLMREANWSGPVPEYLEEVLNNLGNAALVGDMEFSTEKGKGVFDPQLNLETFLGVGLMGGITSSIATGGYLANGGRRGMARDAMTRAAYAVESKMPAGEALERWRELRNEISMRSGIDQAASILSALDGGLFNEEQKAGILDFAKAVQQYRGLKEGKKIRQQEESSDPLQTQLEDSYDAGRKLASAEDMSKARREYTQLKKHTALRLGVDPEALDDMGSADDISLEQIQTLRDRYSTSAVQSYVDYLNAKASYEGMIAGVKSRISDAEVEVEARHRAIAHKNGTIQEAYVNNGSKEGRRVYVQDGVVVPFDGDTRVDTSKSDADIIVRDAETGKLEFVGAKDLISVGALVGLDEAMGKELEEVKQQMAAIASAQIEGQLSFAPGDVYALLNDNGAIEQVKVIEDLGDGSVVIESEGKASKASKEELQQRKDLADEQLWMEHRAAKEAEDKKEEQQERLNLGLARYQVGDELTLESPEGEELSAVVQAEENEDGKVEIMLEDSEGGVFVELVDKDRLDDLVVAQSLASEPQQETSYNAVPEDHILATSEEGAHSQEPDPQPVSIEDESLSPEEAYDAIMSEVEGNEEIGASVLASMIEDKRAELKKIQSSKLRKASTISDKIAAEKDRLQAIEAAQRSLEHWEAVAGERQRRALEEERKVVEARKAEAAAREELAQQKKAEEEAKAEEARQQEEAMNGVPDWADDKPADARSRGWRKYSGEQHQRQLEISGVEGKAVEVKFSDKDTVPARTLVIEAGQLQPSHLQGVRNPKFFIEEAQPKDRTDSDSVLSAQKIAANIRPEEITRSATAYTGAPTINGRGEVIQGNNRADALRYMYDQKPEQSAIYRQWLIDNAEQFGLDPEAISSISQPVLVNKAAVSDSEAIRLGQMTSSDTESGGIERIKAGNTIGKMGQNADSLSAILLRGAEDETLLQLIDKNAQDALRWMQERGYISDTQYLSAFAPSGALRAEAKNDLVGLLSERLFAGAGAQLREDFNALPAKAQKAILATAHRDGASSKEDRMLQDIQDSIRAYSVLSSYLDDFNSAKTLEDALGVISSKWYDTQVMFEGEGAQALSEVYPFSNFALHLAAMYQGATQRYTQLVFTDLYNEVQGVGQDMFDEEASQPKALAEAIKRVIKTETHGRKRSNPVEDAHEAGDDGGRGRTEPSGVRDEATGESRDEATGGRGDGVPEEEVAAPPATETKEEGEAEEPSSPEPKTEPAKEEEKSAGQFGLVSDDRMEELKRRLREKLRGQANMGVDPEILSLGLELAVGYLDRGLHKFVDFAKALIEDLGDEARPYAKAFYNGARDMPEVAESGIDELMDSYDTVKSFDIANLGKDKRVDLVTLAATVSKSDQAEALMKDVAEEARTTTLDSEEGNQDEHEEATTTSEAEATEHVEQEGDTSELENTEAEESPVEYDSIPVDQIVGDKFTITKDFHDKNDTTIWVVRHTGGYVEYKVFSKWMNSARKFGNGRYTKYNDINGFIFETLQDARDFAVYSIEETYPKNASEEDKSLVSSSVGKSYYRAGRSSHYKVLAVDAKAGLLKAEVKKDGEQNVSTIEYRIDRVADHIREGRWKEEDTTETQPINDSKEVNEEQSNGTEEVHVSASPSTGEREGGHEPQQDLEVGATAGDTDEGSNAERVDRRSTEDPVPDEAGGGRVPELPRDNEVEKKERAPKKTKKELKPNERNWSEQRGEILTPSNNSARIQANLEAIRLSKKIQEEGREATPEEMATLARWTGWGGLGSAFIQYSQSRKELEELLSPEEMEDAQQSRLSAYYTPAPIIDQLWDIVSALGFKGGAILEGSAGSGNILARMPQDIRGASRIQAVEIDNITGTILSQLYPDADVHIQGFEKTRIAPGSVDLAITNVPFITGLSVHDDTGNSDLSNRFKNIHDFCIAKNVRSLAPKGLGVFITSSGTMDKSLDLLKWLGQSSGGNVDVLGAFRLNNRTFVGAPVTSDIIVVRKRESRDAAPLEGAIDISSVSTAKVVSNTELDKNGKWVDREYPLTYNSYFIAHPEMMGGEMKFAFDEGETYRASSTALYPSYVNQEEELGKWVKSFKKVDLASRSTEDLSARLSYTEDLKGYKLGEIFVREDGSIAQIEAKSGSMYAAPLAVNDKKVKGYSKAEAVNDYRALKEAINSLISHQLNTEDAPNLKELQKDLNEAYDTFVSRYGHLNKNTAISFLKSDVDWPSVQAIEIYEERGDNKGKKVANYKKSDIFSERLVRKVSEEKPSDPAMAVKSSILSRGYVDLEYLAEALGVDKEEAREAALSTGLAFEDPSTGDIESRYSYLSGNVRQKLKDAEAANADGKYSSNISALQEVLPQDIPAHLLPYSLGAKWMPANIFERYVEHKTGVKVALSNHEGVWIVEELSGQYGEPNRSSGVYSEELGDYIKGSEIMELALNLRTKVVSKSVTSGYGSTKTTERVTDKAATAAVADKADEFRMDFVDWMQDEIQADSQLAQLLTEIYNRDMNNYAPMNMPDDFVPEHFEGASTLVKLRPHQAKAAIRATMQPVLLAHEVGTGKTYTMISAAMEMRRLGTARKPMVVVQNATLGQFVASAKKLYPQAKILALGDQDKNEEGRKRFYSQIMYNDWDMVIIPQSAFDRIPDSEDRRRTLIQERVREKEETLAAMKSDPNAAKSPMVRALAKEIQTLNTELAGFLVPKVDEKRAAKARANAKAKAERQIDREVDDTYDFDALGVDALLIDEAHEYKRLGFETAMGRGIKGIDTASSKKAQGLYMKTKSVLERTGGKNVVFATGTPISNTAAEIWTFMRYLMPKETMREYGISNFDDFARSFGRIQTQLEFSTDGKFKPNKRFVGYDGLSELVRIWSQVADTVLTSNSSELNDRIPNVEEGKATDIFLPQSVALRSVMKYVKEQLKAYDKMSGREKKENAHIPLTMYSIAKSAAVDPRLVLNDATDDPNSKTNEAVRQALKSLEESKDYNGTVAIFSDVFNNKTTGFNLYEDIKDKLVKEGVSEDQIVVMRPMSDDAKAKLFDKVNRGEVRVILGSSSRLGTGVNIQERLHTLIHIDAPNRPMDYTQRNGRILRQGNLHRDMDKPVRILRFGVEDSLDVTAYQRLKTKGAIADSIMHGAEYMDNALEYRSIEEEGDNFGDMVATLSGSEYALLKNQAEKDLKKLESKLKQWQADQRYLESAIPLDQQIIVSLKELQAKMRLGLKKIEEAFPDGRVSSIEVGSHKFSSVGEMKDFVKDYNKTISEAENEVKSNMMDVSAERDLTISVNGIEFHVHTSISKKIEQKGNSLQTTSKRKMTYSSKELGLVDVPVSRMLLANALSDIEERIATGEGLREQISSTDELITRRERDLEQMKARAGKPFEHSAELEEAAQRVSEYENLMNQELARKEAKYAAMDAKVEAAQISEVSDEEEDEEDNLRYGYTERMDGSLLSDNAMEAEANGRYPSAMFRKVYGVGIEDFKMFVNLGVIVNSEWHHTGKNYHETDYYAWRDDQSLGETLSWGEDISIGNVNYAKDYGAEFDELDDYDPEEYTDAVSPEDGSLLQWYKDHKKEVKELAKKYKAVGEWKWEPEGSIPYGTWGSSDLSFVSTRAEKVNYILFNHLWDDWKVERELVYYLSPREEDHDIANLYAVKKASEYYKRDFPTNEQILEFMDYGRQIEEQMLEEYADEIGDHNKEIERRRSEYIAEVNRRRERRLSTLDGKEGVLLELSDLLGMDRDEAVSTIYKASMRVQSGESKFKDGEGETAPWDNEELRGKMRGRAEALSSTLGVPVRIVESLDEIEGKSKRQTERMRSSRGWYNTTSGEVVIVLPNAEGVSDVEATVLHEVVGHKGLRQLVGDTQFDSFLDKVFSSSDKGVRRAIVELSKRYRWDMREATEEYIAELAERGFDDRIDRSAWQIIRDALLDLLRRAKLALGVGIGDAELRYMLWRSYQMRKRQGAISSAEDIIMQQRMGVGAWKPRQDEQLESFVDDLLNEGEVRYRRGLTAPRAENELQLKSWYDEHINGRVFQMKEALQDHAQSLHDMMMETMRLSGVEVGGIGDIDGFENAYLGLNRLSSVNHAEIGEWERKYMQPMVDEVAKLTKDEADYGELVEYMQALHGLERNRVMAFQKAIAKDAEAMSGGESTINEKELWQSYLSDPERSENDQAWAERKISVEEWHKKDDEIRSRYAPSYEEKRKEDYAGLTALAKGESNSIEDIEAEAKMIVRLYEQEQDTSQLWDAVRSATGATLDKQLKSGLLSRAAYDHIRGMYQYYIPLRGFDEKTSEDVYAYVAAPTAGQGIERVAKGRTSRADDPLANIRKMAEQTISRGNRNRLVGQRFLNFVRNHPSDLVSLSPVWVEKDVKGEWVLSTPNIPEDASAEEVMHLQAQHDKDMHELAKLHPEQVKQLKQDITSPYRVLSDKQLSEHQMIVRVGGRDVLITINGNPRITQALRGLSNPDRKRHAAIEGTKALGRTLGQLYTTYSPQFVLRNWVRDSGFANTFVYAKEGANYGLAFNKNWAANNPIVLRRLLKDYEDGLLSADEDRDRYFIEFMSNGGETGYMIAQDMAKHKEEIQKLIKEARGEGNSLLGLRVLGEEWELLNRSAELATRFAAYMTSRQMGRSVDRAVWDAKEITVNFNTKGAGGKYVGANGQTFMGSAAGSVAEFAQDLIIFFNPAIQGLANLVAAAKRNPKQTAAYIVSMIALGATMALINGGDGEDDNYFDQSAYKRRHHLFLGANGKYLTLPIPQEIAPFYGLGELMMSIALGKEHGSSFDLGVRALSLLSDFSPIDLGDGVMGVVPSATRPIVDTFVNKDFLGRPIANRTEFNKHAPEYMRVYSRTNPAFVKLSEALNTLTGGDEVSPGWIDTNPAYIEHLVRGYGGGLADLAMTLSDIGKRVVEGDALGARDLPVIKGLYSETDDRMHGRKTNEAYRELLQEVKSTEYRLRSYQSQQRRGVLDAAEKANFLFNSPEMKRLLIFNQWKGILRSLSNQKEQSDSPEDLKFLEAEELRIKRELLKEIGDATK